MNFAIFLHIAPYAGPAERHGSVLLACRRATERYHMVSWQKYKVPLAVWSTVLNLNAKSDNWVRQEKRLSGKVLFISFYYFIFLSLYLLIYLFIYWFICLLFLQTPSPFFFFSAPEGDRLPCEQAGFKEEVGLWPETRQRVSRHLRQVLARCVLDFCPVSNSLDNHLELCRSQSHGWGLLV